MVPVDASQNSQDDDAEFGAAVGSRLQFRIIDLFAITTLLAFVCAMAAPFIRHMDGEHQGMLFVILAVQLSVSLLTFGSMWHIRRLRTKDSGRFLGLGFCGIIRWKHWPMAKSCALLITNGILQLSVAIAVSFAIPDLSDFFPFFIVQLQLSVFTGITLAQFMAGVYPNTIEFTEGGIMTGGLRMIPWDRVDVRQSSLYPDRITLVIRPEPGSVVGDMRVVQVSDSLKRRLLPKASE